MANKNWKTKVSRLIAKIPNIHVIPITGTITTMFQKVDLNHQNHHYKVWSQKLTTNAFNVAQEISFFLYMCIFFSYNVIGRKKYSFFKAIHE